MIALEVHYNGKKVSVAGADREGMVLANVSAYAQRLDENGKVTHGDFGLAGANYANGKRLEEMFWLGLNNLQVGDELCIRICDAESVDPPLSIESCEHSSQPAQPAGHWLRRSFGCLLLLPLSLAVANVVLVPLNLVFGMDMGNVNFLFAGLFSMGFISVVGGFIELRQFIDRRRARQEATEQDNSDKTPPDQ